MEIKTSKIAVLKDSDLAVDRMLLKINESFTGGRVTKIDLVSWIIRYFEAQALEANMEKIRKDHFDQVAYLESVLRELKHARKAESEAPDLTTLLHPITSQLKIAQRKKGREELSQNE